MDVTKLGRVPRNTDEPLLIKATNSGITVLKENAFRRRYTGNKYSAVDINGQLWLQSSELKKEIQLSAIRAKIGDNGGDWALAHWDGKLPAKKKARVDTPAGNNNLNPLQISANLSTVQPTPQADNNDLSTLPAAKPQREYFINKREVRQRIIGFMNTQRGKKELYFWTVTFPAGTSDDIAYRMFNIWLTALRQRSMLKDYLWIAERQDGKRNEYRSATNTVHFHIAIPHKMSVQYANSMMRTTLKTFAKRGEIPFSPHACKRYNGVDIKKNRDTKRVVNFAIKKGAKALANYLTKYVTKNDTGFKHLAWHNSRGYSAIFTGLTFTVPEFQQFGFAELLACDVFTGGAPVGNEWRILDADFFLFIPWRDGPPAAITSHLYELNTYIQNALN